MKHLLPTLTLALAAAPLSACSGCGAAASSTATPAPDAAPSAGPSASEESFLSRRAPSPPSARPPSSPPPLDPMAILPKASREPDWDLSSDDPAQDYARRYALITKRYGDAVGCVEFGASQPQGGQRRVETRVKAGCPAAGTVRDVFLVDVAGDRLTVDDKGNRAPLGRWPDGSSPEAPASPTIREIIEMRYWTGPLKEVFQRHQLVPVRVQAYGRGSYPVVSVAGWHGDVQRGAPPEVLRTLAEDLCRSNLALPLGVFAASDRVHMLRVRCPASTRWDTL